MAKIKVIEGAHEVYWETTHEGIIEIDGTQVDYRYHESPNGTALYVYSNGSWTVEPEESMVDLYDTLYECLSEFRPEDLEEGEEFEY